MPVRFWSAVSPIATSCAPQRRRRDWHCFAPSNSTAFTPTRKIPPSGNVPVRFLQADYILDVLGDGVALVHPDLRITWANTAFEKWCGGPVKGRTFYEALGSPNILGPDYCPFHTALAGKPVTTRLHCRDNLYVELSVTPSATPPARSASSSAWPAT